MARNDGSDDTSTVLKSTTGGLARYAGRPEHNPAVLYLQGLKSKASARTMQAVLTRAARIFDGIDRGVGEAQSTADATSYPWSTGLTYAKTSACVAHVAKRQPASARMILSALRQVARHAFNLGQLDVAERMRIDDIDAPELNTSEEDHGRRLTPSEVARLYATIAADTSPFGRRDAAIIAVGLGHALRRFEIAALDVVDYARPSRLGRDPVEIKVRAGKGDKLDVVVGPIDVAEAIESWLDERGRAAGPLFTSSSGRGRPLEGDRRLSVSGVYNIVVGRGKAAKLKPEIAPHDLRRTSITVFLEQTGDLGLAKKFARHSSPETTARYDHRERDAVRKAMASVRTGYTGGK